MFPPGDVTTTFAAPGAPAGITHVAVVDETMVTFAQATPPMVTVIGAERLVPVMVKVPPPEGDEVPGAMEVILRLPSTIALPPE